MPRVVDICRLWGLGAGAEELIGSIVLQGRPGTGDKKGTGIAMQKRNTEKEAVGERSVEKRIDTTQEAKAKELEAQRAMKAKLKGFLENYDLIPKVCTRSFVFPPPHPSFGGLQELIFIGRSMRIIQANNQALGVPVDRISILAREAAKALRETMLSPDFRASQSRSRPAVGEDGVPIETGKEAVTPIQRWIRAQWMYLRIRAAIAGFDVFFSVAGLVNFVLSHTWSYHKVYTPLQSGIGEEIEERMMVMAKEFGVELDDSIFEG